MSSRNSMLRRYYQTIRSYLPCSDKLKKQILTEIRTNINEYLREFPEAQFSQVEARFGMPQSIAAAYVDDMNTAELLRALRIRRRIVKLVICSLLLVLIVWAGAVGYATANALVNYPGNVTVITWEGDSTLPPFE